MLRDIKPGDPKLASINIYDASLTPEDLWGADTCPSGGALLDAVLSYYGVGTQNVPWFTIGESGQTRSIIRSPLSRELQESTVESYKQRIFNESISQVAAGDLAFPFHFNFHAIQHCVRCPCFVTTCLRSENRQIFELWSMRYTLNDQY